MVRRLVESPEVEVEGAEWEQEVGLLSWAQDSAEIVTVDARCVYISQDQKLFYLNSRTLLRSVTTVDILCKL